MAKKDETIVTTDAPVEVTPDNTGVPVDNGIVDPTPAPAEEKGSKAVLNADTPESVPEVNSDPNEHTVIPSAQGSDIATKVQNK